MKTISTVLCVLWAATLAAQPRPHLLIDGSVTAPPVACDGTPRELYWGNVTGRTLRLDSIRLQQAVLSTDVMGRPASYEPVAVDLQGRVYISHPGVETGPKTLLRTLWEPDAEPADSHVVTVQFPSAVLLRAGEWLTLVTTCHRYSGFNVTHDATLSLTYTVVP